MSKMLKFSHVHYLYREGYCMFQKKLAVFAVSMNDNPTTGRGNLKTSFYETDIHTLEST